MKGAKRKGTSPVSRQQLLDKLKTGPFYETAKIMVSDLQPGPQKFLSVYRNANAQLLNTQPIVKTRKSAHTTTLKEAAITQSKKDHANVTLTASAATYSSEMKPDRSKRSFSPQMLNVSSELQTGYKTLTLHGGFDHHRGSTTQGSSKLRDSATSTALASEGTANAVDHAFFGKRHNRVKSAVHGQAATQRLRLNFSSQVGNEQQKLERTLQHYIGSIRQSSTQGFHITASGLQQSINDASKTVVGKPASTLSIETGQVGQNLQQASGEVGLKKASHGAGKRVETRNAYLKHFQKTYTNDQVKAQTLRPVRSKVDNTLGRNTRKQLQSENLRQSVEAKEGTAVQESTEQKQQKHELAGQKRVSTSQRVSIDCSEQKQPETQQLASSNRKHKTINVSQARDLSESNSARGGNPLEKTPVFKHKTILQMQRKMLQATATQGSTSQMTFGGLDLLSTSRKASNMDTASKSRAVLSPNSRLNSMSLNVYGRKQPPRVSNYVARLGDIRPGATIDQLKSDITKYVKENLKIKSELHEVHEYVSVKEEQIKELQRKTREARHNKDELFRDCSTFEINFAKHNGYSLKSNLDEMKAEIQETVSELMNIKERQKKNGGSSLLSQEQKAEVLDYGKKLGRLKEIEVLRKGVIDQYSLIPEELEQKEDGKNVFTAGLMKKMLKRRSTIKSVRNDDLTSANNNKVIRQSTSFNFGDKDLKEPMSAQLKSPYQMLLDDDDRDKTDELSEDIEVNRAQIVMQMLLICKEQIQQQIRIGGQTCFVTASYVNGLVQGHASSEYSTKKHEFEFEPLKCLKRKPLIIAEINRLYWDYFPPGKNKFGPQGKQGVVLCVKTEAEQDPFDFNFLDKELIYLAQIKGSKQKYVKMVLTRARITDYESSSGSSASFSEKEKSPGVERKQSSMEHISMNDSEKGSLSQTDHSNSYLIDEEDLYIDCKVHMPNQVLNMDVNLDWYPELKKELVDVYSNKRSLIDLAWQLENDFVIYEEKPQQFKLGFIREVMQKRTLDGGIASISQAILEQIEYEKEELRSSSSSSEDFSDDGNFHQQKTAEVKPEIRPIATESGQVSKKTSTLPDFVNLTTEDKAELSSVENFEQNGEKAAPEIFVNNTTGSSCEEDEDLETFNFMYKVRYANPDRFKTSMMDFDDYMNQFKDVQKSSRPHSARSRFSQMHQKNHANYRECYDCEKETLSVSVVQELQLEDHVESKIIYTLEDFGTFAPIKMTHKPEKTTHIALIFVRKSSDPNQIKVAFGYERGRVSDESPNAMTQFSNLITFEKKLIKELKPDEIDSLDQLMDQVPKFCENLRFKKIIWEEMHSTVPHKRKRPTIRLNSNSAQIEMTSMTGTSPKPSQNYIELQCEDVDQLSQQLAVQESSNLGSKSSNQRRGSISRQMTEDQSLFEPQPMDYKMPMTKVTSELPQVHVPQLRLGSERDRKQSMRIPAFSSDSIEMKQEVSRNLSQVHQKPHLTALAIPENRRATPQMKPSQILELPEEQQESFRRN